MGSREAGWGRGPSVVARGAFAVVVSTDRNGPGGAASRWRAGGRRYGGRGCRDTEAKANASDVDVGGRGESVIMQPRALTNGPSCTSSGTTT